MYRKATIALANALAIAVLNTSAHAGPTMDQPAKAPQTVLGSNAMTYPMIGKKFYVEFPSMSFYLRFISTTKLEFIVKHSPDLPPGSAHTVDIVIKPLRDGLYLVSWQEKSGNTVVHLEDFNAHRVDAFLTMKDLTFIRQSGSMVEAAD